MTPLTDTKYPLWQRVVFALIYIPLCMVAVLLMVPFVAISKLFLDESTYLYLLKRITNLIEERLMDKQVPSPQPTLTSTISTADKQPQSQSPSHSQSQQQPQPQWQAQSQPQHRRKSSVKQSKPKPLRVETKTNGYQQRQPPTPPPSPPSHARRSFSISPTSSIPSIKISRPVR